MTEAANTSTRSVGDKREAILQAALRLVARSGLHDAPMSAVAREAGVAAGTPYLYFPSKEAMLNALYLDLLRDRHRLLVDAGLGLNDPHVAFSRTWHALARWELEHPDASSFLLQCQTAGILTGETRDAERRLAADGRARFQDAVAHGELRRLSIPVFWALFVGPIHLLAQMRAAGELEITDEVLRATFEAVSRGVLPGDGDGA